MSELKWLNSHPQHYGKQVICMFVGWFVFLDDSVSTAKLDSFKFNTLFIQVTNKAKFEFEAKAIIISKMAAVIVVFMVYL